MEIILNYIKNQIFICCDAPEIYQLRLQDLSSSIMEGILMFNKHLLFIIVLMVCLIGWLIIYTTSHDNYYKLFIIVILPTFFLIIILNLYEYTEKETSLIFDKLSTALILLLLLNTISYDNIFILPTFFLLLIIMSFKFEEFDPNSDPDNNPGSEPEKDSTHTDLIELIFLWLVSQYFKKKYDNWIIKDYLEKNPPEENKDNNSEENSSEK